MRARPCPIFGRPVHRRGVPPLITARYFSSNPSDSGSLRTPCPPPACAAGRQGITPAFGYSAPHPSAGGTLTLLIHALPSTHYDLVRILIRVHAHRSAFAFMSRSGMPSRTRMRPPRFRTKDFSTCMGSPTARGSSPPSHSSVRMLPSRLRTGSAPRNSTRFAAQYPAHGLPCERFKLSLAASPCITRGRSGWLGLTP